MWSSNSLQIFSSTVETEVDAGGDCMKASNEGFL